jgi:hypothetical protein
MHLFPFSFTALNCFALHYHSHRQRCTCPRMRTVRQLRLSSHMHHVHAHRRILYMKTHTHSRVHTDAYRCIPLHIDAYTRIHPCSRTQGTTHCTHTHTRYTDIFFTFYDLNVVGAYTLIPNGMAKTSANLLL